MEFPVSNQSLLTVMKGDTSHLADGLHRDRLVGVEARIGDDGHQALERLQIAKCHLVLVQWLCNLDLLLGSFVSCLPDQF